MIATHLNHRIRRIMARTFKPTLWKLTSTPLILHDENMDIAMRLIATILALSVLHGALAASVPGEILFCERNPGRDYSGHYYANFGYDCGDETYWLHGADGGRLAILNPKTGHDSRSCVRPLEPQEPKLPTNK
jgi:hypothetical protein